MGNSYHRLKAGALLASALAAQSLTLTCQGFKVKAAENVHPVVDVQRGYLLDGDYSLLFVRKESKGKVKTLFINEQYYVKTQPSAPRQSPRPSLFLTSMVMANWGSWFTDGTARETGQQSTVWREIVWGKRFLPAAGRSIREY